ncbi:hypothetical protein JIG36_10175 [Actinoplanes sp. LDG1-06]|uniref:Uncharacterized protein n=1 Tax=Paractinoplanes ovalisporus TaxID=2810368 RepID=A0ABS2A7W4_9ACTN|nr:hypothetical protein [Actinoplanes ovalisporus]MBM2615922.1 hypothetical protein [Actinoplanes ovalisporus]
MKAATRILTLAGLSLMTGATLGAAPAMASTSAPDPAARTATTTADQPRRDREWTVGYYDSRRECEWIGRVGERRDRWDDYDCDFVRWGRHRGDWELSVSRDRDWRDRDNDRDRGRDHDDDRGPGDDDNRQR